MKKIILATLLIGMVSGCIDKDKKGIQSKLYYDYDDFAIVLVDSCEYVVKLSNGRFVHKANCKNDFHKGGNNDKQ
jgi:hypothetical protein